MNDSPLKRTPLFDRLVQAGGRMVDFHGWEMPVQFAGILAEHRAVRTACGVFDVSHMGQVLISGPDAHRFAEHVNCNRMSAEPGKGTYAHILAEDGGILDDAITFCLAPERFLAVVIRRPVGWTPMMALQWATLSGRMACACVFSA